MTTRTMMMTRMTDLQSHGAAPAVALERKMVVAHETKKEFAYGKDTGQWYWHNRGIPELHGPFPTFSAALDDAVAPYFAPDADEDD